MKLCIVQPKLNLPSETFLRAHAERLPADVTVVHTNGGVLPMIGDRTVLSQSFGSRAFRKTQRLIARRDWEWEITNGYLQAFRGADAVLAEYGPTAVAVADACELAGIPLIAHFHGYDASKHDVLKAMRDKYPRMFTSAAAIIAVSTAMGRKLVSLGAPPEKVHVNACGVDCEQFAATDPGKTPPTFVAVGRFVEKKAPYLTLLAFAEVQKQQPETRLRMVGDGPLLGPCRDMARGLGLTNSVSFLGGQPHDMVAREMQIARAFVQHSIESSNGDCEGTPVGVLEASASALPVVSTRHAGIPDVVVDGETGLLVDEKDVRRMAEHMLRVAHDPQLAARLGRAGRERIVSNYTMDHSISRLWSIVESCAKSRPVDGNGAPKTAVGH